MAVVLAEHRLERCLAAADRVLGVEEGSLAFDGPPEGFLEWALERDEALATPGARLFELAGLRPLPASVKSARAVLRDQGLAADIPDRALLASEPRSPLRPRAMRRAASELAFGASDLWVELDDGETLVDVLRGLSVAIERGERVALMGRNGAGKSTLLRTAAGVLRPARGRASTPAGCALLGQSPSDFIAHERVGDELPGREGSAALERVGLSWAAARDPRDLSGGERQRLALAIVLAGREGHGAPGLVCLDEPTRGMDRERKHELAEMLDSLAAACAATVVATHDVEFAASFARRVILLGGGRVIADGPAEEILAGGWYFATEVARILGEGAPVSPERGAGLLRSRLTATGGRA
jgi:energy-coupling factor transport system ATP-binding protein